MTLPSSLFAFVAASGVIDLGRILEAMLEAVRLNPVWAFKIGPSLLHRDQDISLSLYSITGKPWRERR